MKRIIYLVLAGTLLVSCTAKKEKTKEVIEPEEVVEVNSGEDWVVLFDGKTFNGWRFYNGGEITSPWTIENGTMVFAGREKGSSPEFNIITEEKFKNFELSLEWKISEAGNSGIFWGVHEKEDLLEPYRTGPEIQVLDNERHPDAQANPKYHQAGALYDMVQPAHDVCKPAGEWNAVLLKIDHRTNKGSVTLNGTLIVEFPVHGEGWDELVANSKFKDWEHFGKYPLGHIGLQDHEDKVWYRNIKIKKLD